MVKTPVKQPIQTVDTSKPDGTPKKLMDSSRLRAMGWFPKIDLERGITETYNHVKHLL
jgi:GDP-L-fucose synthase